MRARRWRGGAAGAAAEAGIHRLAIPTPFQVGRVNAYLIEDSPLTLIDSGPNSAKALDELEQALAARGHAVEDIELLVVSHQHMDHFGLASILARRSGAEVAALDALAPFLPTTASETDLDDRFAERIDAAPRHPRRNRHRAAGGLRGLPRLGLGGGGHPAARRRRRAASCATARCACCTGRATAPRTRSSSTSPRAILLAADHLIAHISSNPLLARPLGAEARLRTARARRRWSPTSPRCSRRARWSSTLVLPGHGAPITDHVALIDERFRLHGAAPRRSTGLIAAQPRTAHEIAQELWGNVAVTQAYLTLSEVLGHVDLLLDDGRVVEREDEAPRRRRGRRGALRSRLNLSFGRRPDTTGQKHIRAVESMSVG